MKKFIILALLVCLGLSGCMYMVKHSRTAYNQKYGIQETYETNEKAKSK